MHYCKNCNAVRSGGHNEKGHLNNPLFLSYNMRIVLRLKYPHVYILPQSYYSLNLKRRLFLGYDQK